MSAAPDLFTPPPPDALTLNPCQSLALRRMIDALKADDRIYAACPDVVRSAIADLVLPPYHSAEEQIVALEGQIAKNIELLEKFERRLRELEAKLLRRAA